MATDSKSFSQLSASFRQKAATSPQVGIFTRLTTPEPYEILSLAGLDALVIDVEHGAFDRASLSRCTYAALSGGLPTFVRLPSAERTGLQHAVGLGVTGIVVPHLTCAEEATDVAAFVRGPSVVRAHAGATRSSRYRESEWGAFRADAGQLLLLMQIDDLAGVAAASALARVDGFDGAFLGRISLSLELEGDMDAADRALEQVCASFGGKFIGISLNDRSHALRWRDHGVTFFAVDSDQRLLLTAARASAGAFRRIFGASTE